jgi:hypothetical protein
MTLLKKLLSGSALLALTALFACGGGGGGSTPPPPVAPSISVQPADQSVLAGATATFSVTASGTAPLSYQWKKGGTAITGATSASYTTPATVVGDSGATFTVTVTNTAGSVTSSVATLTVQPLGTALAYTDPVSGTYLLKKNTTLSTATHLVLDLVGPAATTGCGVTATFSADTTKVTWVNVAASDPANTFVANGTAFTLGAAPQILKGKLTGASLQVAASQKGTASPVALNAPLLRIALDLKAGLPTGAITLASDNAKAQMLDGTGTINPITVSVGTLSAQ